MAAVSSPKDTAMTDTRRDLIRALDRLIDRLDTEIAKQDGGS